MRYPVGKNKEDFEKNWYVAQGYGARTSYGYHEGVDLNLKTGGNTDLGQPIYCIADGEVTSVHFHPSRGFGNHLHIKHVINGKTYYSHYAHCQEIFVKRGDKVKEGQKIATVGSTGNSKFAHLHFAIKNQPTGIEGIARTKADLSKWENPLQFIKTHMSSSQYYKGLDLNNKDSMKVAVDMWYAVVKEGKYVEKEKYEELKEALKKMDAQLREKDKKISELNKKIASLEKQVEITENKAKADLDKARIDYEKKLEDARIRMAKDFELKEKQLKEEIAKLKESKEVVVKKGFVPPKDFKRRFILALQILLGVYDG